MRVRLFLLVMAFLPPIVQLERVCELDVDCPSNQICSKWQHYCEKGTCKCPADTKHVGESCYPVRFLHENCTLVERKSNCDQRSNLACVKNRCECAKPNFPAHPGFVPHENGKKCRFNIDMETTFSYPRVGENCSLATPCVGQFKDRSSFCDEGTCRCSKGFKGFNGKCYAKEIGDECADDMDCKHAEGICRNRHCYCPLGVSTVQMSPTGMVKCGYGFAGNPCTEAGRCSYGAICRLAQCVCPFGLKLVFASNFIRITKRIDSLPLCVSPKSKIGLRDGEKCSVLWGVKRRICTSGMACGQFCLEDKHLGVSRCRPVFAENDRCDRTGVCISGTSCNSTLCRCNHPYCSSTSFNEMANEQRIAEISAAASTTTKIITTTTSMTTTTTTTKRMTSTKERTLPVAVEKKTTTSNLGTDKKAPKRGNDNENNIMEAVGPTTAKTEKDFGKDIPSSSVFLQVPVSLLAVIVMRL